jgi:hypothetical protein
MKPTKILVWKGCDIMQGMRALLVVYGVLALMLGALALLPNSESPQAALVRATAPAAPLQGSSFAVVVIRGPHFRLIQVIPVKTRSTLLGRPT